MLKVNEYFNGHVMSIGFQGERLPASVGVMVPGDYEFGTSEFETMRVISGELRVLLPETTDWQTYKADQQFTVPANSKFKLRVLTDTAYLCTYGH
ncbi:MAG: pyrimidine/purine nucleoside phosphorylase [Paraglaciecola sp.]|nr:pyrimidine/purine nucleoside phosphorylase [Paraglaciecola sp.]